MVAEVARLFGPAYKRLIKLMRQQAVVHVDETGWRVDGHHHWLWIFVNEVVSLYVLSRSRGSKVPKAWLSDAFEGVVIRDFFRADGPLAHPKAKGWAHLLRDSHALTKAQPPPDAEPVRFHHDRHALFLAMGLALEQAATDEPARQSRYQIMRTKLLALAQQPWQDPDCQRLVRRIDKHLAELLVWLRDPAVPPDNNKQSRRTGTAARRHHP
jgi:hypothetical protein